MINRKNCALGLAVVLTSLVSGCATISSEPNGTTKIGKGIPYYLPKGLVNVRMVRSSNGQFIVSVKGPEMVADETALFYADLRQGALSDDVITVSVDPKTSLLTTANVTSTGRATEFIENVTKFAVNLQSGEDAGGVVIYSGLFEIDSLHQVQAEINGALNNYYTNKCNHFGDLSEKSFTKAITQNSISDQPSKDILKREIEDCRLMRLSKINTPNLIKISVGLGVFSSPKPGPGPSPMVGATSTSAESPASVMPPSRTLSTDDIRLCRRGLCHRPMRPYVISTRIGDSFQQSETFLLPDTQQLGYSPLPGGAFATQKYTLTFNQGVLVTDASDTKSELVGFSTLPIKILKAVIAGPAEALGVRKERLTAEQQYLQTVTARSEQIEKTNADCRSNPENCPNTALKIMRSKTESANTQSATEGSRGNVVPGAEGGTSGAAGNQAGSDGTQPTGDD